MPEQLRLQREWQGEITKSPQVQDWYAEINHQAKHAKTENQRKEAGKSVQTIDHLIECLRQFGPGLRRPHAGKIERRKPGIVTMFELRGQNPFIRIIYAFDHKSDAVLLYGWDKEEDGKWKKSYEPAIAAADRLYDDYLASSPVTRIPTRKGKKR